MKKADGLALVPALDLRARSKEEKMVIKSIVGLRLSQNLNFRKMGSGHLARKASLETAIIVIITLRDRPKLWNSKRY